MGDTHVLCSLCRLPIIIDEDGNEDPTAGERPKHIACRIKEGRADAALAAATSLALRAGRAILGSGIIEAMQAWDREVGGLQTGPPYAPDELRDLVQRVIIVLLVKHDARHAALLGELETLFGKFPEPVRAAS
ncbi:hypothetical protein M0Q28_05125 [Patescibacteria group bacterium]|jgi:hypothetical protein|nr:hypothetical protein [Patescibacteria group bacterium]